MVFQIYSFDYSNIRIYCQIIQFIKTNDTFDAQFAQTECYQCIFVCKINLYRIYKYIISKNNCLSRHQYIIIVLYDNFKYFNLHSKFLFHIDQAFWSAVLDMFGTG